MDLNIPDVELHVLLMILSLEKNHITKYFAGKSGKCE